VQVKMRTFRNKDSKIL